MKLKKEDIFKDRKFVNTFHFIDDLCAINDDGLFERYHHEIYPPELELKKEHGGERVSLLYLDIKKVNKKFEVCLYDKRDSFPFFNSENAIS